MPVVARYHALRDRVLAAVDWRFAEPVRLSFLKKGEVDDLRPTVEIEAILRLDGEGKSVKPSGQVSDAAWRTRAEGRRGELHIDRMRYPDLVVRSGDKVKALARHGEPWFEVGPINDRSHTRLVLSLSEA